MKLITTLLLCSVAMGIPGCQEAMNNPVGPPLSAPRLVVGTGTILPSQAECISWYLGTDSGALYELTQLDAEFQHVDLRVRFSVRERKDLASVCMRGAKVEVVSMTRL